MKNYWFGIALMSLALSVGCAKGGNGVVPTPITVSVSAGDVIPSEIYPTQSVPFTATVSGTTSMTVTWSLSGTACTGSPNPCGTIGQSTGVYVAPAAPVAAATVTATLASDPSITGTEGIAVIDITTDVSPFAVAPSTLNVGKGLAQQFTAVAVPDAAPQIFTWTCTANGAPCANFVQDANVSGLAVYTADDTCSGSCVQISAASTLDQTGCAANPTYCTNATASLVTSRVSGTYAFRFSGYNSSGPTAVVGTFVASNGTITSGLEDEITSSGWAQHSITGGSYVPIAASAPTSNNAGTLTLTNGTFPNKFQVVLDGNGDLQMIESDGHGSGSGIAQTSAATTFFKGNQTFAFGFTGVDSAGNRVGYAGILPMNGSGTITGGQMDVNDNGSTTNVCGSSPCNVTGSYSPNACNCGLWHMTLTTSASTMQFDFYISSGQTIKTDPLTFYAISTDPSTNPAVWGTMALQDSSPTYNNAAFKGTSVSALTGANGTNANVSLTLGTTDGKGNFSGQFDQNNAGTILSYPGSMQPSFAYTYAASSPNKGRYTIQMLGNPGANPVVAPLPFILYASGQNRGFLLDQSSSSVMTGTMNPQGNGGGQFSFSEAPGTYAAATTASGSSNVSPGADNLLLTSTGGGTYNVSGTQYPGPHSVTGTYTLSELGTGTIALSVPSTQNYVIYVLDSAGCVDPSPVCAVLDFLMMDVDATNPNASIIFAQQ
jgi:hypothetical protein